MKRFLVASALVLVAGSAACASHRNGYVQGKGDIQSVSVRSTPFSLPEQGTAVFKLTPRFKEPPKAPYAVIYIVDVAQDKPITRKCGFIGEAPKNHEGEPKCGREEGELHWREVMPKRDGKYRRGAAQNRSTKPTRTTADQPLVFEVDLAKLHAKFGRIVVRPEAAYSASSPKQGAVFEVLPEPAGVGGLKPMPVNAVFRPVQFTGEDGVPPPPLQPSCTEVCPNRDSHPDGVRPTSCSDDPICPSF